jgi:hypothetical protein
MPQKPASYRLDQRRGLDPTGTDQVDRSQRRPTDKDKTQGFKFAGQWPGTLLLVPTSHNRCVTANLLVAVPHRIVPL